MTPPTRAKAEVFASPSNPGSVHAKVLLRLPTSHFLLENFRSTRPALLEQPLPPAGQHMLNERQDRTVQQENNYNSPCDSRARGPASHGTMGWAPR